MPKQETVSLRKTLAELLRMKGAHLDLDTALADFPAEFRGARVPGSPHTVWQLLEHMRIAQEDILEFCRNPKYKHKAWPDDYWPKADAPPSEAAWTHSIQQFHADLEAVQEIVADTKSDLLLKLPHGTGQTLLREALLVADHNAYHLGQLVLLKKILEAKS